MAYRYQVLRKTWHLLTWHPTPIKPLFNGTERISYGFSLKTWFLFLLNEKILTMREMENNNEKMSFYSKILPKLFFSIDVFEHQSRFFGWRLVMIVHGSFGWLVESWINLSSGWLNHTATYTKARYQVSPSKPQTCHKRSLQLDDDTSLLCILKLVVTTSRHTDDDDEAAIDSQTRP